MGIRIFVSFEIGRLSDIIALKLILFNTMDIKAIPVPISDPFDYLIYSIKSGRLDL